MAQTRLRTQDPRWQASTRGVKGKAVRLHLLSRLTEKQYRRVALLYGFDGPEMSQRKVAEAEGVAKGPAQRSIEGAIRKLKSDGYLWTIWLVGKHFRGSDTYKGEARQQVVAALYDAETGRRMEGLTETEMKELAEMGFGRLDLYPGEDGWETNQYHPRSSYDRTLDRLTDEFQNGSLTRVEYDRDMILALAEDMRPDSDALEEDWIELKQEVEWACGGFELGGITKRERDRRVSMALRAYVSKG